MLTNKENYSKNEISAYNALNVSVTSLTAFAGATLIFGLPIVASAMVVGLTAFMMAGTYFIVSTYAYDSFKLLSPSYSALTQLITLLGLSASALIFGQPIIPFIYSCYVLSLLFAFLVSSITLIIVSVKFCIITTETSNTPAQTAETSNTRAEETDQLNTAKDDLEERKSFSM